MSLEELTAAAHRNGLFYNTDYTKEEAEGKSLEELTAVAHRNGLFYNTDYTKEEAEGMSLEELTAAAHRNGLIVKSGFTKEEAEGKSLEELTAAAHRNGLINNTGFTKEEAEGKSLEELTEAAHDGVPALIGYANLCPEPMLQKYFPNAKALADAIEAGERPSTSARVRQCVYAGRMFSAGYPWLAHDGEGGLKTGPWDPEENDQLEELIRQHGNDWKEISRILNRGSAQTNKHCKSGPFHRRLVKKQLALPVEASAKYNTKAKAKAKVEKGPSCRKNKAQRRSVCGGTGHVATCSVV